MRLEELSFKHFNQLNDILNSDTMRCATECGGLRAYSDEFDRFWARVLVRSFFAQVEGNIYQLKKFLLDLGTAGVISLTSGEVAVLSEETYDLDQKGQVKMRPGKYRFEHNFRFIFTLYAKKLGIAEQLVPNSAEWGEFKKALQIRHKLTHPKQAEDLNLNKDDVKVIREAILWYARVLKVFLNDGALFFKSLISTTSGCT